METELINHYIAKILIAARPVDSIHSIAKRIHLSYGWTYKWIKELINLGVFKQTNNKIVLQENHQFYNDTIQYIKNIFGKNAGFHYSILRLMGIKYCFVKTDAVFIWTKGGYNIGRSKEYYPIFIKVKNSDRELFEFYCKKMELNINLKEEVFYYAEFEEDFEVKYCENAPVESLEETIRFMKKYIYNFQPALEMISKMYKKNTGIKYQEASSYA